jgi:hypothetical protein
MYHNLKISFGRKLLSIEYYDCVSNFVLITRRVERILRHTLFNHLWPISCYRIIHSYLKNGIILGGKKCICD